MALTKQQHELKTKALAFLDSEQKIASIVGYAGTGKTYTIAEIVRDFRANNREAFEERKTAILLRANNPITRKKLSNPKTANKGVIIGCAPTHKAKDVLAQSTNWCFDAYGTVQSVFSMKLERVKFTQKDQLDLSRLQSQFKDLKDSDQSKFQIDKEIQALINKREKSNENKKELVSTNKLNLAGVRLIVIDESSMVGKFLFSEIVNALRHDTAEPDLQIIFMGDPGQLPPIKEKESLVFTIHPLEELTKVVRNSGNILRYLTKLRDRPPNLMSAHSKYINKTNDFIGGPMADFFRQVPDWLERGEEFIFVAPTNRDVDRINKVLRSYIYDGDLDYREGDLVLTRGAVERRSCAPNGEIFQCKQGVNRVCNYCETEPIIGTSQFLQIKTIHRIEEITTPADNTYRCFWATVEDPYTEISENYPQVRLLHIEDQQRWEDEKAYWWSLYSAFKGTANSPKGQRGKAAQEVFKREGMKSWDKRQSGAVIHQEEYQAIKQKYLYHARAVQELFDPLAFCYAATVHRLQGVTMDRVIIDMGAMKASHKRSELYGNDPSWDMNRILYTAGSRAAKQLIFGF